MPARQHRSLLYIAVFKWIKSALLILLGFGLLHLLGRNLAVTLHHLADALRVDPDNKYLTELLAKAPLISSRNLQVASALTFAYAALFLVEGTGLFFEKKWAEYLTIIATASFLPLEIYEIAKHPNGLKVITLILNLAILVYLILLVVHHRGKEKK
ncbi:MAG: DUF2127 domain-containing protein [Chthoniobacterales bacterium]